MTLPSDEELRRLEEEFKKKRAPDTVSYIARLVPTIVRFYLDGYSRQATYDFLRGQSLISCSRTAFYKWLEANVNLAAEAQSYLEAQRRAEEGSGGAKPSRVEGRNPVTASQQVPQATVPRSPSAPERAPGQKGHAPQSTTFFAPLSTTLNIESTPAAEASDVERERARKLAILNSTLSEIESKDMGTVAERARAKLAERDSSRGRDG